MNAEPKHWYQSLAVWGGLLAIICAVGSWVTGMPTDELMTKASEILEKFTWVFTGLAAIGIRRALGLK